MTLSPDPVPAPSPPAADAWAPLHARPTILLVDDDDAVRRVTARYLAMIGYTVVQAEDATHALAAMDSDIDVVLSDVGLPGMPGPALLQTLHAQRPSLRKVLMTGLAGEALSEDGWPPNTSLLSKPFTIDELRACLSGRREGSADARSAS
jgi:DNA-binding NtrC family response regulator